jgi:iron(III) transport system permease protein
VAVLEPAFLEPSAARTGDRRDAWRGALPILVAALVLAPVGGLVGLAARGSIDLWPHLIENVLPHAVLETVQLLAGVGILVAIVGVGTAWLVATCDFPGRRILDWALLLPLAMPTYIVAFAYLDILHPVGPVQSLMRDLLGIASPADFRLPDIRSLGGCIILLGFVLYPYVYISARAMFLMQSATALEVARTLGAGPAETFFRVALPLARPAIALGVTLALLEALNDIGASEFLGVRTLTVSIYVTWVTRQSVEGAAQIALAMLVVIAALVWIERWARRRQGFSASGRSSRPPGLQRLAPLRAALATLACLVPILIGFVFPALYLVDAARVRVRAFGMPDDLSFWAWNSIAYSGVATIVTLLLGLLLASAARRHRGAATTAAIRLASLGYAIPGTVLAVGLLTPLALADNLLDDAFRAAVGWGPGLLLSGSGFALVYAYASRFLAIAASGTEAGYAKIPRSLDDAARSLGESRAGIVFRVHLPMLRPAILGAALLVFVDCMKELPATLLLRPFGYESLATYVYGEAARGTYEDGAVAALAIVLVGLLPVAVLARMSRPTRRGSGGSSAVRSPA